MDQGPPQAALEGFDCDWFRDAQSALDRLGTTRFQAVASDIRLADFSGAELFQRLLSKEVFVPPWIFITGYGTIDRAIALLKLGAADYVTKPFDLDQLVGKLRLYVPPHLDDDHAPTLGLSPGIRRIEEMLPRLVGQSTTILRRTLAQVPFSPARHATATRAATPQRGSPAD